MLRRLVFLASVLLMTALWADDLKQSPTGTKGCRRTAHPTKKRPEDKHTGDIRPSDWSG
jgi:hypothetical protein